MSGGQELTIECSDEMLARILLMKKDGVSRRAIANSIGIGESTLRYWEKVGKLDIDKPIAGGTKIKPHQRRIDLHKLYGKKVFVFTAAQNNTFVFEEFKKSLGHYIEHRDAALIVGGFTYNKSGFQNQTKEEGREWFDSSISEHLLDQSATIFPGLIWCGELNILPTAITPLTGFETYCKEASGIIPHAKVQLKSVATSKQVETRMMYTTGCITLPNYIQKTAGQKAEFHHVHGALVVEVDKDGDWFVRQLIADSDTGCFYDLTTLYTPNGIIENQRVEGINWGDLHSEKPNLELYRASFGAGGSMLDDLKPKYQFAHDTLDFTIRNHHNIKDPYHRYKMQLNARGMDRVEDDIAKAGGTLCMMQRDWCETVVVESNHDLAFFKWLKESDPATDNIWNALYYHQCQVRILESFIEEEDRFSIFEWAVRQLYPELEATFLRVDDSFVLCPEFGGGIECGNHGHVGRNGSRGSVMTFKALERRQNVGHVHGAYIRDSAYAAGIKGDKNQEYNIGPDDWSYSDIVTYPNGKRAIITWKNNKYRAQW